METKLTDLQNEKPKNNDKKENNMPGISMVGEDYQKYPWGTTLSLDDKTLEKLNIDVSQIKAGSMLKVVGEASVTRVSKEDEMDKEGKPKTCQRLEIQIQKLALSDDGSFESGFKDNGKGD
jgi:hypothetical protein